MIRRKTLSARPPYLKEIDFSRGQQSATEYPFTIPLFKQDFTLKLEKTVTIFTGENGSGKSTLLECIAHTCGFNMQGGSRDHAYSTHGENLFIIWRLLLLTCDFPGYQK